jgi:site-specific DNA-adenine methylase
MSKQTAVEYLIEVLRVNAGIKVSKQLQEEVLKMEKEQIIEAHLHGMDFIPVDPNYTGDAENYYNETYKKEEK